MTHSNLVADKLHSIGFRTKVLTGNTVKVSLSKRKPCRMEVEIALEQLFEGISFTVKSLVDSVLVVVED